MGFEPTTVRLQTECSTVELNPLKWYPCGDLNPNHLIESQISLTFRRQGCLVDCQGLEPQTYELKARCSNHWANNPYTVFKARHSRSVLSSKPITIPLVLMTQASATQSECMVLHVGIEPTTFALQEHCSTYWASVAYLERIDGLEPSSEAWKATILPLNYTRITL